jgi:hypothetical protein
MIANPLFVTLQHHVQYSGAGYPQKPGAWDLHRHTRIVSVADVFDAMTTARHYRESPLSPGRALRFIHKMSGTIFDPVVVNAFIRSMGVYPVGTTVRLDTGESAVVVRQNAELHHMHRPFVMLVNGDGPYSEPVDLAARPNDDAPYTRTIVDSTDNTLPASHRASCFITE